MVPSPTTGSHWSGKRSLQLIAPCVALCIALDITDLSGSPVDSRSTLTPFTVDIQSGQLLSDLTLLSETFQGRQTGTLNDVASAKYIAERFRSLGLQPAGTERLDAAEPWFMTQPVTVLQISETPQLSSGPEGEQHWAVLGKDYLPVLDAPSVDVLAPVVFVGYGLVDSAAGLDEYRGQDVRGKIALFLRGKPERYPHRVTHVDKVHTAKEKGAAAYLTATGPILSSYDQKRGLTGAPLAYYGQSGGTSKASTGNSQGVQAALAGAWIGTSLAETLLATSGRSLVERQQELNRTLHPQSTPTGQTAHLQWDSTHTSGRLVNVLGRIPNSDGAVPGDRKRIIVLGAHRDHFGQQGGLVFPGADDNASGTAILLEVARILSGPRYPMKHPILFVSFSGEEQGLLGSRLYIDSPPHPIDLTLAMVNVDHAGVGNGRLTIGVSDLPKSLVTQAGDRAGLAETLDIYGFFPGGDQVPFKEAGVPTVTIVSSGVHAHVHRPTDGPKTVNPEILGMTVRYLAVLALELANQ